MEDTSPHERWISYASNSKGVVEYKRADHGFGRKNRYVIRITLLESNPNVLALLRKRRWLSVTDESEQVQYARTVEKHFLAENLLLTLDAIEAFAPDLWIDPVMHTP